MPIMPCGTKGGYQGSPHLTVLGHLLDRVPRVLHGLEPCLHRSAPGVSWSSPILLSFRRPMKGCASDIVLLSPPDVPNPSPSPSHDDGLHAFLIAAGEKLLVGDGVRPKHLQDSPEVLCVEDSHLGVHSLSSSSIQCRIVGWTSHSFCRPSA